MVIYFVVLILIILADLLKLRSSLSFYIITVSVGIFLCFGYMTGSDWRSYEALYIDFNYNFNESLGTEIGYIFYMSIFKLIFIDFWVFFIFTKLIIFSISIYFIYKYIPANFYFALAIFYCSAAVFEFIDNPMRNLLAGTVYMFSFKYIIEQNFKKYISITFIAIIFHYSLIIFIPFYFILNRSYKTKNIILTFILFNVVLLLFNQELIMFFKTIDFWSRFDSKNMTEKIIGYVQSDEIQDRSITLGLLARYLIFIIVILFKKTIEGFSKYGKLIFNSTIASIFILRLALIWPITVRFLIPFSIFYCVALAIIINHSFREFKFQYYIIFIAIYIGVLVSQVTSAYKYIPYTNYIFYLGSEKPSFMFRSNYNYKNSPYK